jgi:N-acetylglucosamine kinase-like BadF-type ATPase
VSGLVLGLDGGGTQTRALLCGFESDTALGEGRAGACSLAAVSVEDAAAAVLDATQAALAQAGASPGDIRAVCAGVAGFSVTDRRAAFQDRLQSLFPQSLISVVPDYAIALTGATEGAPGVLVIAGTGSVAWGENAQRRTHKTGGYGYLIDDAGSGYGVGRAALAAVLRAEDGTGAATALSAQVQEQFGLTSGTELITRVYGGDITRVRIASLAPLVAQAASEGDAVASAILMRAGGALAVLVQGVTTALFADTQSEFPVALVGGLWAATD